MTKVGVGKKVVDALPKWISKYLLSQTIRKNEDSLPSEVQEQRTCQTQRI